MHLSVYKLPEKINTGNICRIYYLHIYEQVGLVNISAFLVSIFYIKFHPLFGSSTTKVMRLESILIYVHDINIWQKVENEDYDDIKKKIGIDLWPEEVKI